MTREAHVEAYLRARVKGAGGVCIKLNPKGLIGIPDRLVLLPGGVVVFVEVKRPKGGVISKMQLAWRNCLIDLGMAHRFVLTREDVDALVEAYDGT